MKQRIAVFMILMLAFSFGQLDYYPQTIIAEDITATWCGYCPDVYAGLDVMHSEFNFAEFQSIRYYDESGNYSSTSVQAMIDYYNPSGFPTTIINGDVRISGGGENMESGASLRSHISANYFNAVAIKLEIANFDPVSGAITADVTMHDPEADLQDVSLFLALVENDVAGDHTHVAREIIEEQFSLSGQNNVFSSDQNFVIEGSFDTDNLEAIAFARLTDGQIIQAASTYPVPDYRSRFVFEGEQIVVGPSEGINDLEEFHVVNVGLDDNFTMNIVVDEAPDGSMVTFCDENSNCYPETTSFSLATENDLAFHANVIPGGNGMIRFHFELHAENTDAVIEIPFTYITDDTNILLVDDDGGDPWEDYYIDALEANAYTFAVWDLSMQKLSADMAANFNVLVWNVGFGFPTLDAFDRETLSNYIDAGGKLFISGQDVGWDLCDNENNLDVDFYHNYLHANFLADDANFYDLDGVDGDPVSDGISLHIEGGDGADNQEYPSRIEAFDDAATEIFHYTNTGSAGAVRATHPGSGAKIVYFSFGFEAIDNPDDRQQTMEQIQSWFAEDSGFVPVIEGFVEDMYFSVGSAFSLSVEDLIVVDEDSDPDDLQLNIYSGDNYSVDGDTVIPDQDFSGELLLALSVSDGMLVSPTVELPVWIFYPGDINQDSIVNILDIIALINIILEYNEASDYAYAAGDANGDGIFNVLDIIQLMNLILNN